MAGGLKCKICDNEINYKANLPRILMCCGYTICNECLIEILATTKKCPSCKKATKHTDAKDYLVNTALLDIKNDSRVLCRVKYYQKCREELVQRKKDFEDLTPHLKATLAYIDTQIKQVNEFHDQVGTMRDKDAIQANINSFQQCYEDILIHMAVFPISLKLIKTALNSDQEVVALYNYRSTNLEATLTMKGKRLCVHAYQNETPEVTGSKTACYRDLQDVLLREGAAKSVYAFLEISTDLESLPKTVMIKISKSKSYLGSQFLKLCSGEIGRYVDDHCTTSEDDDIKYYVQVNKPPWERNELDNYAKYFLEKANFSITCSPENCYVHMENDGSFDIFRCKRKSLKRDRIIGQVVDYEGDMDNLIGDFMVGTIVDSGVAYDFE